MSPSHRTRKRPVARVVASILLIAAVVASFWVPLYARSTPKIGAFPFFYWYQLILVPAVAIVSWCAYLLLRTPARAAPVSLAPEPEPSGPPVPPALRDADSGSGAAQ